MLNDGRGFWFHFMNGIVSFVKLFRRQKYEGE